MVELSMSRLALISCSPLTHRTAAHGRAKQRVRVSLNLLVSDYYVPLSCDFAILLQPSSPSPSGENRRERQSLLSCWTVIILVSSTVSSSYPLRTLSNQTLYCWFIYGGSYNTSDVHG